MGLFSKKERTLTDMYADKKRADADLVKKRNAYNQLSKPHLIKIPPERIATALAAKEQAEAYCKSLTAEIDRAEVRR